MPDTSIQYQYLERDPKSSYKQLSIKGRRIRGRTLYGQYASAEEPRTPEQIAATVAGRPTERGMNRYGKSTVFFSGRTGRV